MSQYHQPEVSQSPTGTVPPYQQDPSQMQKGTPVEYFVQPVQQQQVQQQAPMQHQYTHGQVPGQAPIQQYAQPGQMPMQQIPMGQIPMMAQPGQIPQQQHHAMTGQQPSKYQQAVPIPSLGRSSAPVDCPSCGKREMTTMSYEVGNSTHAWAAGICFCFCLGCIPYLINGLKDVQHRCGSCGVLLATWHRSGTTETHMSA